MFRNAGKYGFKLSQETRRILLNHGRIVRISGEGRANVASGVIHKDAGSTVLGAADIPSVLIAGVRISRPRANAPRPGAIPQSAIELEVQLAICAVAQLLNAGHFYPVKAREGIVKITQH